MKKILITRRLLRSCEDKAKDTFEAHLNLNDEMYSQKKLIELSNGYDGILSSLTDKLDAEIINKLPDVLTANLSPACPDAESGPAVAP